MNYKSFLISSSVTLVLVFNFITYCHGQSTYCCDQVDSLTIELVTERRDCLENTNECERRASGYARQVTVCENRNDSLMAIIRSLRNEVNRLTDTVKEQREIIASLRKRNRVLEDSLDYYDGVMACINQFQQDRREAKMNAREEMDRAKVLFGQYNSESSERERVKLRRQLWDIYAKYNPKEFTSTCGPITLSVTDTLKNGYDHYITARLLVDDDGEISNSLGNNFGEKIHTVNVLMLTELGNALNLAGDDYNLKNDSYNLFDEMYSLLITETKYWLERGEVDIDNTDVVRELERLVESYKSNDFATSVGIYNKYRKVLKYDEMLSEKRNLVHKVKYAVGNIMLWDLGNVSGYRGLSVTNGWFDENSISPKEREIEGRKLLKEVIKEVDNDNPLKRDAQISAAKKY